MFRILISGASGLIGSALLRALESSGNEVFRLVRHEADKANEVQWDPMRPIPAKLVSGYDAVIHLSGENVAGRWNEAKKKRIRDSRVISTQNLARALGEAQVKPAAFVCASAIGYYGRRGDVMLTEESGPGEGFLAEVCREWEAAARVSEAGIRVVNLRIGIVLSRDGGALEQMLLPFRLGLGGRIGSGRQWWSWIHVSDLVGAVEHALQSDALRGAVNLTAPTPVTNNDFTKALAEALHRPAVLPIPAFAARLAFGELADEGLLASARVSPHKLIQSGFVFQFPELRPALKSLM
ncbi:MAG TPA: TIGR01777 family oxidoreductase [Terriglobales bacterium]